MTTRICSLLIPFDTTAVQQFSSQKWIWSSQEKARGDCKWWPFSEGWHMSRSVSLVITGSISLWRAATEPMICMWCHLLVRLKTPHCFLVLYFCVASQLLQYYMTYVSKSYRASSSFSDPLSLLGVFVCVQRHPDHRDPSRRGNCRRFCYNP